MLDQTPVMGDDDRQQAQRLSQDSLRPPLRVPGYEQERFLGRGAFGEVWVAVDSNSGRTVAIKYYTRRGAIDWGLLAREVEKLRHLFTDRYVVQLLAVGWNADPPYYVMEYMENGSLEDRLRTGPMPVAEAVEVVREVARGLVHAHGKGILHCDLKPGNVLLDQDGKPRLADFGQSRLSNEQTPSLGTLFYMAPEQADLKGVPDARWDVYALGALLYCMVTGSPPFRDEGAQTTEQLQNGTIAERLAAYRRLMHTAPRPRGHRTVPDMDAALADIIDRCLAVNPKDRYPNVEAVLTALNNREQNQARRPWLVLGAVAPALVLLVMALAGWGLFNATIQSAEQEVTAQAMQGNRFAARAVADRFALDIDKRWRILACGAADPELIRRLEKVRTLAVGTPGWDDQRQWFQTWLDGQSAIYDGAFTPATRAVSWFINDQNGVQVARSPSNDSIGKTWAHRDYFHGQGQDLPTGSKAPLIHQPHRSVVFRSTVTKKLTVAFSVPIWPGRPGVGEPVGVLAMTSQIGRFAEWQGSPSQFTVLVDTRPGETGRPGMIIEHPVLEKQQRDLDRPTADGYVSANVLEQADRAQQRKVQAMAHRMRDSADTPGESHPRADSGEDFQGDFHDPLVPAVASWLVALEPVIVAYNRDAIIDTGWTVLVEQKVAEVLAPVESLRWTLLRSGLLALLVVIGVVVALWGFVILVLDPSSSSPLVQYLRRSLGLARRTVTSETGMSGSLARTDASQVAPRQPPTVLNTETPPGAKEG